jgi:hypothetical protein
MPKCGNCKSKQEEIEAQAVEIPLGNFLSGINVDEVLWAHTALQASGMTDEHKQRANNVYRLIFNEDVNFGCGGCKDANVRKLDHYIKEVMKIQL